MKMNQFFTAKKALRDYRENKSVWTGGAVIVATDGGGFQAIPGVYRNDASYTGSRTSIPIATVRASIRTGGAK